MKTREVTGTWVLADLSPASGRVLFTPSRRLVDRPDGGWAYSTDWDTAVFDVTSPGNEYRIVVDLPVACDLDTEGSLSAVLLCNDNPHLMPAGWLWRVTEQIVGRSSRHWWLDLPDGVGPLILGMRTAIDDPAA